MATGQKGKGGKAPGMPSSGPPVLQIDASATNAANLAVLKRMDPVRALQRASIVVTIQAFNS